MDWMGFCASIKEPKHRHPLDSRIYGITYYIVFTSKEYTPGESTLSIYACVMYVHSLTDSPSALITVDPLFLRSYFH